ncbi:MAG: sulfatase-like hydrolase/transferase, partial [Treponema sp.]|nr:sulfatase-like hydrolase/transferase [Treponema sp.]
MKNVLFVLTDDQRYDCVHAAGNPDIITPNLDRLAASGTLFT